jgi:hypothetical protein
MPKATSTDTTTMRVAPGRRGLLGGAAALLAGAAAVTLPRAALATGAGPDAVLIRMVDILLALDAKTSKMWEELDDLPRATAEIIRERDIRPLLDAEWEMRMEIAGMQATTLDGFRAKARLVQCYNNCAPGFADLGNDDALAWSLANDLLGVASVWRPDDGEG